MRAILLLILIAVTACAPKDSPRQVHEPGRDWTVRETPESDEIVRAQDFVTFDMNAMYAKLNDERADLTSGILVPLRKFVLNREIVENPRYRTAKLAEMIQIFNSAFARRLEAGDKSQAFLKIKSEYYDTVFSGCSADLREDCVNDALFAADTRHTRIMTLLARELDAQLDQAIRESEEGTASSCVNESAACRALLDERYRRLAMGNRKTNWNADSDFAFAYLKYARAYALLIDYDTANGRPTGYISQVHGKIFETLIARYQPSDVNDPEFKAFVENFNPWVYSQKKADVFRYGTKIMFEFGTKCCLYQDAAKTELSEAVREAIRTNQEESDTFGPSFREMMKQIREELANEEDPKGERLFRNLGMLQTVKELEKSEEESSFYNEYFLVVDRLFRGHLNSSEVEMVLRNAPRERTRAELPRTVSTYIKVYLMHMVIETNKFMNSIYTSNVSSDKVFEEAVTRSRELTSRWHNIQSQIELVERVMGSYFKSQSLASAEFNATSLLIKSVNRNIHYLSVYPNMIVMTYFLSKMKGSIVINTWWGTITINADTILDAFFDGQISSPWFRFGKDQEPLDRQMLLFGWEYMLSTDALAAFSSKESGSSNDDRGLFFDLIFSKYLDDNLVDLHKDISTFEQNTFGSSHYGPIQQICRYESGVGAAQVLEISLPELSRYTYSGLGANGANVFLMKFLTAPKSIFQKIRGDVDSRRTYLLTLLDLVESNLIRSGQIKEKGEPHRYTRRAREVLAELEEVERRVVRVFHDNHRRYFDCYVALQEIERRRTNRLLEEEREHLGKVFDMMAPLWDLRDNPEALAAKVNELNATHFRAGGYRFDEIQGTGYRMSKYDLLMRMKDRIERDIFRQPSANELRVYGDAATDYVRPRPITVRVPEGIERDDMVARQPQFTNTVLMNGNSAADREDFIRQGLAALNGKTGSFIEWHGQRGSDSTLVEYLSSAVEYYLLGTVVDTDGREMSHSAQDLADDFVRMMASYGLDEVDVEISQIFGNEGRQDRVFFKDKLFEANGNRLPLFYKLITEVTGRADLRLEFASGGRVAEQALKFAQTMNLNNQRPFVFQPPKEGGVEDAVKERYGTRVDKSFIRVRELFTHIEEVEAKNGDVAKLDPRLTLPQYLQAGVPITWYLPGNAMVDRQKQNDFRIQFDDFVRRSGGFYNLTLPQGRP